jgi:hypothetical protein
VHPNTRAATQLTAPTQPLAVAFAAQDEQDDEVDDNSPNQEQHALPQPPQRLCNNKGCTTPLNLSGASAARIAANGHAPQRFCAQHNYPSRQRDAAARVQGGATNHEDNPLDTADGSLRAAAEAAPREPVALRSALKKPTLAPDNVGADGSFELPAPQSADGEAQRQARTAASTEAAVEAELSTATAAKEAMEEAFDEDFLKKANAAARARQITDDADDISVDDHNAVDGDCDDEDDGGSDEIDDVSGDDHDADGNSSDDGWSFFFLRRLVSYSLQMF